MDLPAEVYGQLSFLICTLMIRLRFLQPVNCSITCQEKINYLLGKWKKLRYYLRTAKICRNVIMVYWLISLT